MRSTLIALAAALIGVAFVVITLAHGAESPAGADKTLKEITIEGEVRLPEVLFITSRDVARPLDAVAGYLVTEDSLTAALDHVPVRVHVASGAAAPALPDPLQPTAVQSPAAVRETEEEVR